MPHNVENIIKIKDEKKRIEFETSSLTQYYDFKPHIDMIRCCKKGEAWNMISKDVVNAING